MIELEPVRMTRSTTLVCALAAACSADPLDDSPVMSGSTTSTVTTGATGDVATESSESSTGPMPDVGQEAPTDCSVWEQDCPPGEKCTAYGDLYDVTCSPVPAAPGQVGDPCVFGYDWDSCDVGAFCWFFDLETTICIELCKGSPEAPVCSDPDTECVITNEGALNQCMTSCDPTVRDCPTGTGCYRVDQTTQTVCVVDASGAEGQYGDGCEDDLSCDPGLFCGPPAGVPDCAGIYGCCSAWCDLTAPDPDAECPGQPEGQRCVSLFAPAPSPPGAEHVGVCTVPA